MYIQVIPLYLQDDTNIHEYIKIFESFIDELTGDSVVFVVAAEISQQKTNEIVNNLGNGRYKQITLSNLPCFLVEVSHNEKENSFIVELSDSTQNTKKALRALIDASKTANSFEQFKEHVMNAVSSPPNRPQVPSWFPKAGYVCIFTFIVFLMAIIVVEMSGHPVPPNARMLVVFLMATVLAAGFSFIGGHAIAEGNIPFPFVKNDPVKFGVGGGGCGFCYRTPFWFLYLCARA
jgi:hypothetical protein